jgi:glycosyltransferase involved in cell wall biosynthesis
LKILLLIQAPVNISPGQRFRFEQYIKIQKKESYTFVCKPFFDLTTWNVLHKNKHTLRKVYGLIGGLMRRVILLFQLKSYYFIYIYREAAPIGPPIIEWIIAKIFRKKIIYDFDDSIWLSISSEANPLSAMIKCTWKVKKICRYSYIVSAGNEFLASYARNYCKDVRVIPSVVNTEIAHNRLKNQSDSPLVIGWTGTYTNLKYLNLVIPAISKLQQRYDFIFMLIGNKDPEFKDIKYTYLAWKAATEIEDLLRFNIGIMPLEDTEIEKGKCAFKAIQYMSLGIPAVVSPVGANCELVENGVNGYWADSENDWYEKLERLINNIEIRINIGKFSRVKIIEHYSVKATSKLFYDLFK